MTFNPNDYVSANESIILSGTAKTHANGPLIKLILTNKKLITAGDDYLNIISLNCISRIGYNSSTYGGIDISTSGNHGVSLYYSGNPSWYNEIVTEISKRIG